MTPPLLLDLFCGKGGWSKPALARGWRCIGFDVADHGYPGELRLESLPVAADVLLQLEPDLIVASPPCEDFARACLPWLKTVKNPSILLLKWSIALAHQVKVPVVIECSRFAARYVPGARFCGSYALWGSLPALLPTSLPRRKQQQWGRRPADRAMIEPELASWILDTCLRRPLRVGRLPPPSSRKPPVAVARTVGHERGSGKP